MLSSELTSIPEDYLCPITQELMKDPVLAADGHSYERQAIMRWIRTGHKTSPLTGERLKHDVLTENHRLKAIIQAFQEKLPRIQREAQLKVDLDEAIKLREEMIAQYLEKKENESLSYQEKYEKILEENKLLKQKLVKKDKLIQELQKENEFLKQKLSEKDEQMKSFSSQSSNKSTTVARSNVFEGKQLKTLKCSNKAWGLEELSNNVLAASEGDNFNIWDLKRGKLLCKTTIAHKQAITALKILSTKQLASSSFDNTIKIWDIDTSDTDSENTCVRTLTGHKSSVCCLAALPTGELASGSDDRTVKIWDAQTGGCRHTLKGHQSTIWCLEVLPTGELASGAYNDGIRIWNTESGACVKVLLKSESSFSGYFKLLPKDRLAYTSERKVCVWDIAAGKRVKVLEGHSSDVLVLELLLSGELVSGDMKGNIKVWDLKAATCLYSFAGESGEYGCPHFKALSTGNLISSSDFGTGSIKIWK